SALYVLTFCTLLFLTRYFDWCIRIVTDQVWATWLTWLFFFLRQVPAVQCWVLERWFQAIRRTTRTNIQFIDPPVTTGARPPSSGAALLALLRETPRLWLCGPAGMGKSSVFAAWEREFFASEGQKTLRAAARKYGFIPIMLRVREYAALQ